MGRYAQTTCCFHSNDHHIEKKCEQKQGNTQAPRKSKRSLQSKVLGSLLIRLIQLISAAFLLAAEGMSAESSGEASDVLLERGSESLDVGKTHRRCTKLTDCINCIHENVECT